MFLRSLSQQLIFKVSAVRSDACSESNPPLFHCSINKTLIEGGICVGPVAQLVEHCPLDGFQVMSAWVRVPPGPLFSANRVLTTIWWRIRAGRVIGISWKNEDTRRLEKSKRERSCGGGLVVTSPGVLSKKQSSVKV
jgi:hypothetical protein